MPNISSMFAPIALRTSTRAGGWNGRGRGRMWPMIFQHRGSRSSTELSVGLPAKLLPLKLCSEVVIT